jgi:hypothetical protein
VVVIADMEHLVARTAVLRVTDSCGSMAHLMEVGELLGVEVEKVTGSFVLIAVRWFLRLEG